jgi:HAE1 family hydrophobic/amphiphilic exporter-1
VVGGLIVSQTLTLFVTPVFYIYLERLQEWLGGRAAPVDGPGHEGERPISARI